MQTNSPVITNDHHSVLLQHSSAIDPSMRELVLNFVSDFLDRVDTHQVEDMLHELMREFTASKVWAKDLKYNHKLSMMDNYKELMEFFTNIGSCAARE